MKNTCKYILLGAISAVLAFVGCAKSELDTDQLGGGTSLAAFYPNPVMRGGALSIIGRGLDQVDAVLFTAAEEVAVTEFQSLKKGNLDTLEVVIPLEGPEVGPVSIKLKDGKILKSHADLTFTEPIEISSFAPATVYSGDVLTVKGEYLNVVREVIFPNDVYVTEFEAQTRHELKVRVPFNAVTGKFILSDINELQDGTSIPNKIYSTDLTVGKPTVVTAAKATYKSGDVITVTGEHLDMIEKVDLEGAKAVAFTIADDAKSITFNLPLSATDGHITLTSYAGDAFDAGEIETVTVTELSIASIADDGRYKAGTNVEITGEDLDLVTKVEFTNAEASFSYTGGKITATVPAAAKDGNVTVTLGSGKQAFTDAIEVVKPVVTGIDRTDAVAGADTLVVSGTDLDLVTAINMGTKEQTFIPCEFKYNSEDGSIDLYIPAGAYSGVATLISAAGYETTTSPINVTYDLSISISFPQPDYSFGSPVRFIGKNLFQIESIVVKGEKVNSYVSRTDTEIVFNMPEKHGPGMYRLELTLIDGTQLTWPVPFAVVAPYTETFIWEGSQIINGWSGVTFGNNRFIWTELGAKVGDLVRIYFTAPETGWWDLQLVNGYWTAFSLAELGGGNEIKQDAGYPGGSQTFTFEITEEVLAVLTEDKGWDTGAFIINGDGNVEVTGLSILQFGAAPAENKTVIWEGSHTIDWSGGLGEANKAMTALSWGGYDWSTVEPGTVLRISYDAVDGVETQIRVSNGGWSALPGTEDPFKPEASPLEVEFTQAMIDELVANGGMVITGQGATLTEVALVTAGSAPVVPTGETIWEGEQLIDWSGNSGDANKALTTLSWGGYDWSTVSAGTTLVVEYTPVDGVEAQLRVSNSGWAALPGTEDPYKPTASPFELELTQAMLDELTSNNGLVLTGQGMILTAVILK